MKKEIGFILLALLTWGNIAHTQSRPVGHIQKNDSLTFRHHLYLEVLGPGIIGSVGYDYRFIRRNKLEGDLSLGVGGTYLMRWVNPWTAFSVPCGLNITYLLTNRFHLTFGVYWVNYFNYWGIIKNSKNCAGVFQCPPDYDDFWAPRIGVSYNFSRFSFELNCYKYFDFWAYNWFIPSLKIKYKLK